MKYFITLVLTTILSATCLYVLFTFEPLMPIIVDGKQGVWSPCFEKRVYYGENHPIFTLNNPSAITDEQYRTALKQYHIWNNNSFNAVIPILIGR